MLGFAAWTLSRKYRRLARHNLALAFAPEETPGELRRHTRRHFQRLGANLLCSVKLGTMPLEKVTACVTLENENAMHDQLRAGRGVVLGSHPSRQLGTFRASLSESFRIRPHQHGFSGAGQSLYRRRYAAISRTRRGRAIRSPQWLSRVRSISCAAVASWFLADQHAGDHGLWTPFFGRLASTSPLPALLAKRTARLSSAPDLHRLPADAGEWSSRLAIDPPDDSVESLTVKVKRGHRRANSQAPEDWFWVHNRWKTPRPNFLLPTTSAACTFRRARF